MKRTITGRSTGRTMTLGDVRKFLTSIEGVGDEAQVKARTTPRRHLRALTVEDEDTGLHDYLRSIGLDDDDRNDQDEEIDKVHKGPKGRKPAD